MNKTTFGRAGEQYAVRSLEKNGYRILVTNYKAGGGELDIVAMKRGIIVFAEVKTRSDTSFGTPASRWVRRRFLCYEVLQPLFCVSSAGTAK